MQVHKNRPLKRAGVAGKALRAERGIYFYLSASGRAAVALKRLWVRYEVLRFDGGV